MPLKIVHVGLGGFGQDWVAYAVPRTEGKVEQVAWVDTDPANLAAAQKRLGLAADRCFTAFDEAIAAVEAEAVLVTTPLLAHIPVIEAALTAGKHVLVEKPFAPSLAEGQRVVDLAADLGLTLMVSQNYRHQPAPRAVAALIASGELGPVGEVMIDFRHDSAGPKSARHHQLPNPLLIDMAIHHFDLLRMILGQDATSVSCHAWNPPWSEFVGDAAATATILFEDGPVASWRGSWVSPGAPTTWGGEWRVECAGGEIAWQTRGMGGGPGDDYVRVRPRGGTSYEVELPEVTPYGRAAVLVAFAEAIAAGTEPETSGRDNLRTLAIAEAAVRSSQLKQPVELEPEAEVTARLLHDAAVG